MRIFTLITFITQPLREDFASLIRFCSPLEVSRTCWAHGEVVDGREDRFVALGADVSVWILIMAEVTGVPIPAKSSSKELAQSHLGQCHSVELMVTQGRQSFQGQLDSVKATQLLATTFTYLRVCFQQAPLQLR